MYNLQSSASVKFSLCIRADFLFNYIILMHKENQHFLKLTDLFVLLLKNEESTLYLIMFCILNNGKQNKHNWIEYTEVI